MLAIGSDDQSSSGSKVFVYEYSESARRWLRIDAFTAMTDLVHDIAFAPNLGRSYHVLAIASKELKMLAIKPLSGPHLTTTQNSAVKRIDDSQSTVTKYDVSSLSISDTYVLTSIGTTTKINIFVFRLEWLANTMTTALVCGE